MTDLKTYVIENVPSDKYYQKRFPEWNDRARPNVPCPFHNDGSHPNLSISLHRGGARCHSTQCGKRFGNIVHFEAELQSISETKAALNLYAEFIRPIIPASKIRAFHRILTQSPKFLNAFKDSCSITRASVGQFSLGLDTSSSRITIPIFDQFKNAVNIRYYALPQFRSDKTIAKIYNQKGFGKVDLFPQQCFENYETEKTLFWMHAEKDTMLGIQKGLQAFCLTGGEGSWSDEILNVFADFNITICGVNDTSGRMSADRRLHLLQTKGRKKYSIFNLPSKEKDFADWITKDEGDVGIMLNIPSRIPPSFPSDPDPPPIITFEELINVSRNTKFLNHVIRVKAIIAGKSDRLYSVPYKFKVTTPTGIRDYTVPIGRDLLRFIRSTDEDILKCIKLAIKNPRATVRVNDEFHYSISELEIIPFITANQDSPYVTQKCFYVGENIEANVPYEMEIMPTTEIRSQETVGIITKAVPINPSQYQFSTVKRSALRQLEVFQPEQGSTVYEWISQIAIDLSIKHTKIFNRVDWHLVALLTWACPLQFNFPYEDTQRGWFNSLAIGDTKTGKSEVVNRLRELVGSGTYVNAENCTLVGLIGGAISSPGGGFMLRWGKIPLNNRGLVIIEELSGLSIREISNLSEARSSGKARLDKGGLSSETNAKTRLIFLSNVRGKGKSLSSYISGVRAIEDLVGHAEDISRFDLISTLTVREVSTDIINSPRTGSMLSLIDLSALKQLIHFIWSLPPDRIEITKPAYHLCLTKTKELGRIYHPSIPLFDAGSGRLKLARVATAIACLCFNWDGTYILVEPEHITAAADLLQTLYDKPSCGYREYSEQMYYRETIENEDQLNDEISKTFSSSQRQRIFKYILHVARFTADELSSVGGIQMYPANRIIGRMISANILRKGEANTWELTTAGKHWIEGQKNGDIKVHQLRPASLRKD